MAARTKSRTRRWKPGLPRGEAFAALAADAAASGARNPEAVAAAAGRRKLGQAEMTRRAVAGRRAARRRYVFRG